MDDFNKKRIHITTFYNPNLFWFLYDHDIPERNKLEYKINQEALKQPYITLSNSAEGEKVLIHYSDEWLRAEIVDKEPINVHKTKFLCWLLDYGVFVKVDAVYQMHDDFKFIPPFIKKARLYGLVSVKKQFSIETNSFECMDTKEWNPRVQTCATEFLQQPGIIQYFVDKYSFNDYILGNIIIETADKITFQLSEKIINFGFAKFDDEKFSLEMMRDEIPEVPLREVSHRVELSSANKIKKKFKSKSIDKTPPKNISADNSSLNDTFVFEDAEFSSNIKDDISKQSSPVVASTSKRFSILQKGLTKKSPIDTRSSQTDSSDKYKNILRSIGRGIKKIDLNNDQECKIYPIGRGILKNNSMNEQINDIIKPIGRGFTRKISGRGLITTSNQNNSEENNGDEIKYSDSEIFSRKENIPTSKIVSGRGALMKHIEKAVNNLQITETSDNKINNSKFPNKNKNFRKIIQCHPAGAQIQATKVAKIKSDQNVHSVTNKTSPLRKHDDPGSDTNSGISSPNSVDSKELKMEQQLDISNNEIKPKPICPPGACDCDKCNNTFDSTIVFQPYVPEKYEPKQKKCVKPCLLFKESDSENVEIQIKTRKENKSVTEELLTPRLLVHSSFIIHPIEDMCCAPFNSYIHECLRGLKYEKPTRLQQFAWPAIMRGQNVCLIAPKGRGKTMSYLPALATFILSNIPDMPTNIGPMAIILCPGIELAENIFLLSHKLVNTKNNKIRIAVLPLTQKQKDEIITGVDILICTPGSLVWLVQHKMISLKRLLHVVFEDYKKLYHYFRDDIYDLFKMFQITLKRRNFAQSIQLIITSSEWNKSIEDVAKKLKTTPVICIGSHLEAALYGRADIQIIFTKNAEKPYKVIEILSDNFKIFKSLIICNQVSEMETTLSYLNTHGIDYEVIVGNESIDQKRALNRRWNNSVIGHYFVLVCSDDTLNTDISITDASLIIQYSLPADWSQFVYRFSSCLDNYSSPIYKHNNDSNCKMHIFMDESNQQQFPRIFKFLQRMKCKISDTFIKYHENLIQIMEEEKIKNKINICRDILQFGSCQELSTICKGRHVFVENLDISKSLPQSGIIKMNIVNIVSPICYYARLIEYTDSNNVTHAIDNYYSLIALQLCKIMTSKYRKPILEANVGRTYIVDHNESYERCKVLEILEKGRIQRASRVTVKLIDLGVKLDVSTANLYIIPENIRNIPPQAVEIIISNLGPLNKDYFWPSKNIETILKKFKQVDYNMYGHDDDFYFTGRILLQLNNKIFMENLILQQTITNKPKNIVVNKLNLRNLLIKENLAELRPNILNDLYSLCNKYEINLPNYSLPVVKETNTVKLQHEPKWAHLENNQEYNEICFSVAKNPGLFYVKLFKNFKALNQLRKDMQKAIEQPLYPTDFLIIEGRCYLLKDPVEDSYERVIVEKINGNMADCFFVDYGDHVTTPVSELKFLLDKHIWQLPFQAIECKLYGITPKNNEWSNETTNILYNIANEPESDLFRSLFVKIMDIEEANHTKFKKYSVILIDNYDNNKIINNYLVKMNFADYMADVNPFEIDEDKINSLKISNVNCDSDEPNNNEEIEEKVELKPEDFPEVDEEQWDVQINDSSELLTELFNIKMPNTSADSNKTQITEVESENTAQKSTNANLPQIKAPPLSNFSTPNLVWQQTADDIKIMIHVIGVTKYELNIIHKKALSFKTECNGKTYKLNLRLFSAVKPNPKHCIKGLHVVIYLQKETAADWPRLVLTTEKMRNITYNIESIPAEYDSDDDAMLPLEMFEKSKKAGHIDENGPYFYRIGSDVDYSESDITSYESSDN